MHSFKGDVVNNKQSTKSAQMLFLYIFDAVSFSLRPIGRHFVCEQQRRKWDVRENKYCLLQLRTIVENKAIFGIRLWVMRFCCQMKMSNDFFVLFRKCHYASLSCLLSHQFRPRILGLTTQTHWQCSIVQRNGNRSQRSSQADDLIYLLIYWHIFVLAILRFVRQQREHNHNVHWQSSDSRIAFLLHFSMHLNQTIWRVNKRSRTQSWRHTQTTEEKRPK